MTDYIDDLIVIDQDVFYIHRNNTDNLKDNKKIIDIFALDCFNENSMKMMQASFRQRPHPTGRFSVAQGSTVSSNFRPKETIKPARLLKRATETESEKMVRNVTAYLNKISSSNEAVITEYVYNLIRAQDSHHCKDVVRIIFKKCVTNPTYVKILLSLIDRLAKHFDVIVQECITEFIENNIDNLENDIDELKDTEYSNYDEFCGFMKKKNEILTGFRIVMFYIDCDNQSAPSIDIVFEKIANMLTKFDIPDFLQNSIVQIVQIFFELTNDPSPYILQTFNEIYNNNINLFTLKSKFILDDIVKNNDKIVKNKLKPRFVCKRLAIKK